MVFRLSITWKAFLSVLPSLRENTSVIIGNGAFTSPSGMITGLGLRLLRRHASSLLPCLATQHLRSKGGCGWAVGSPASTPVTGCPPLRSRKPPLSWWLCKLFSCCHWLAIGDSYTPPGCSIEPCHRRCRRIHSCHSSRTALLHLKPSSSSG
ncbi:hypothetical protein SEVIR_1G239302v4 [Setaria viridis]